MIFVDRNRVKPPALLGKTGRHETSKVVKFFQDPENERLRFEFQAAVFAARPVKLALNKLFRGKCAFCEQKIGPTSLGDLEQFRPRASVVTSDGSVLRPGYYWLAYEWSNLYASCPQCNRTKVNRFPLSDESVRARSPDDSLEAEDEHRLLLDPCQDDPEEDLIFDGEGLVASRWLETSEEVRRHERAQTTIDVFGLNRSDLVEMRRRTAHRLNADLSGFRERLPKAPAEVRRTLGRHLSPGRTFAALRRQMVARWIEEHDLSEVLDLAQLTRGRLSEVERSDRIERQTRRAKRRKGQSVTDAGSDIFLRSSQISRVEIRNFGPIEHLDFDLGPGDQERSGWKVLLGENAVGKSSIIRAVAFTVMGSDRLRRLAELQYIDPSKLLRREAVDEPDPEKRCVRVYQATETEPLTMTLHADRRPSFNHQGLKMMLLGFGSARWLPRPGSLRPEYGRFCRVKNLFNPFVPLVNALSWLRRLNRDAKRDPSLSSVWINAEESLVRLLNHEGATLEVSSKEVSLLPAGSDPSSAVPLSELSDGYQTVLAMAISIMAAIMRRGGGAHDAQLWQDLAEAEGLILLDEIGSHLHPRWKMRIVASLRAAFPRLQFLATTHEPLCLRGLMDKEIMVLQRTEDDEILAFDDLPSVDGMSIDQLLTSRLFGLLSTLDLETERNFREYYELLAKKRPSGVERSRLRELRATVGAEGPLGDSPRDQMIYRIADEYLAKKPVRQVSDTELPPEVEVRIAELWKEVEESPEEWL